MFLSRHILNPPPFFKNKKKKRRKAGQKRMEAVRLMDRELLADLLLNLKAMVNLNLFQ